MQPKSVNHNRLIYGSYSSTILWVKPSVFMAGLSWKVTMLKIDFFMEKKNGWVLSVWVCYQKEHRYFSLWFLFAHFLCTNDHDVIWKNQFMQPFLWSILGGYREINTVVSSFLLHVCYTRGGGGKKWEQKRLRNLEKKHFLIRVLCWNSKEPFRQKKWHKRPLTDLQLFC